MNMQSILNLRVSALPYVVNGCDTSRLAENVTFEIKKSSKDVTELFVESHGSIMRVSYCSSSNRVTCKLSLMGNEVTFAGNALDITINDLLLKLWPVLTNLQNS